MKLQHWIECTALMGFLVLIAFGTQQCITSVTLPADEIAVYRATVTALGAPTGTWVGIRSDTAFPAALKTAPDTTMENIHQQVGESLQIDTLIAFLTSNRVTQHLPADMVLANPYELVEGYGTAATLEPRAIWQILRAQHPSAFALITFSRVWFNADRMQAILYVVEQGGDDSGRALYLLLAKADNRWTLTQQATDWVN
jgi:hypothetical protein